MDTVITTGSTRKIVPIRMYPENRERIDAVARAHGMNRSELVRRAVAEWIAANPPEFTTSSK